VNLKAAGLPASRVEDGYTMGMVETRDLGKTAEGETVHVCTLTSPTGMRARVLTYGALLSELHVPDRDGKTADVVLGFDQLDTYLSGHPYFGATTGRYANRIARGRFTLDGREYTLAVNNGPNHLHGGVKGLDKRVWKAREVPVTDGAAVRFHYRSPDMEEGYPGNLDIEVTYTLTGDRLRIDYRATTDKATPVNLTNHSYFHLGGEGTGDILGHELTIFASTFLPVDDTTIPSGGPVPVEGTPMDYRRPFAIGSRIGEVAGNTKGYDHNYCLDSQDGSLALAARVRDPASGRVMEVHTTQPGVQLYTGNFLDGSLRGKRGEPYRRYGGFCLETQHYPDSPNRPDFPSVIVRPGDVYEEATVMEFPRGG
jgi:aldose 1-epimerase